MRNLYAIAAAFFVLHSTGSFAADQATRPAEDRANAWIAKAEKEIPQLSPDGRPDDFGGGTEITLLLYQTSPTETRRVQAVRWLQRDFDKSYAKPDTSDFAATFLSLWALKFAKLGEIKSAQQISDRADALPAPTARRGGFGRSGYEKPVELYARLGKWDKLAADDNDERTSSTPQAISMSMREKIWPCASP